MRDHRKRMLRFLKAGNGHCSVAVRINGMANYFALEWLTDEQLERLTRDEMNNFWFDRKLNRENRMRRNA